MELGELTISKVHNYLLKKKFSALELTKAYLDRIKKEDKEISAFLTITESLAIKQAKKIDDLIFRGKNIPVLAGVPFGIKDNILIKGIKNTCASAILEDYTAPYDAFCVKKLKEQGAVILGKTNLDEFAMGASTENSAFFPTKNPYDKKRAPGGSSGGSAAAVASNLCLGSLGSDTGGSVRQPASFCGVFGLKPTYGAVSRFGLIAFASSLDQIGPMAKTASDAQTIFNVISGKDPFDSTSLDFKTKNSKPKIKNLRVGVPKEYFTKGLDKRVEKIIRKAIKKIESLGAKTKEISLPHFKYVIPAYYLINTSEASANLARYDGIKYGFSSKDLKGKKKNNLLNVYLKSRGSAFGNEVKRRIMLGTYALSAGYYRAYYLKAGKVRTLIRQDFEKAFESIDVIFTPTCPTPAFKLGEKTKNPLLMYLADIFTCSVNLAGLPAISVPVGFADNLPVGLQIIGKSFEENKILEISKIYE